jgi:hypothetical protein
MCVSVAHPGAGARARAAEAILTGSVGTRQLLAERTTVGSSSKRWLSNQPTAEPADKKTKKRLLVTKDIPDLATFMSSTVGGREAATEPVEMPPYLAPDAFSGHGKAVFFETYGCQMNVNDTEIGKSTDE